MLANIHLAGRNSTLTITKEFSFIGKLSERAALLIASIEKISEKTPFDMMVLDLLTLKVELSKKYLPIKNSLLKNDHLVHGDYTDQNIFFDKEGNISHVFDFEKTQYQPRTFELFRSMNLIFMNGDNVEQELLDAKLYINSYLQKYPMKKEEFLEGLDMYFRKLINSVWIESEHYLEGNTRVDPLLKQDYVRVKYFGENIEKIKEVLSYNLYI
jgi:Ser/Thr protein kinase RdoA (MazF antagonist)